MRDKSIQKVMVIGSGPIVIGQAAEFDYAGAQACRVLKEEGLNTVLVNSNPATIMTDKNLADEIYLEPLNPETLTRIIEKERPDGLLAGLGGQTGLTLAMQLSKRGVLQKYGVKLLGTDVSAIDRAEDRELFRKTMLEIGEPCVPSDIAEDTDTALQIAERIGYPIIVRPAFTLGGTGGGIAANAEELCQIARTGLELSPITQILVEKCISGWKEIEFETMRDRKGNAVIVCSMENVDPVGVHTGDSIVAAPALTLTPKEYEMLSSAALRMVSAIGIIGGCNCQFALKPDGSEYAVIEVNPRVSRSSALASKATGYPIAKVTARLALGYTLDEIKNPKTGASLLNFEPRVGYIVVKFPKWPFDKFAGSSRKLGTQMKATGEVMSIAPCFEAALMKAVRGAEIGLDTLNAAPLSDSPLAERLAAQDDRRIFTVFEAIKAGMPLEEIYRITRIDHWFLQRLKGLADYEQELAGGLTPELYRKGKALGYPDAALKRLSGAEELPPFRFDYRIVNTCASVFGDEHPYFYSDTLGECEARSFKRSGKPVIMVLGSGPIRIGQGIEFDYSSVHCVWTLRALGYDVVIVNNNPETVSTDYDTADRLYFEPLTPEDVMNIIRLEKPVGVVVAFGGQTAIKLTGFLSRAGIPILGTSAESIDTAEDRARFDALLEKFSIRRPKGFGVNTLAEALNAAETLGYPVLLRPSYVIGGQNMTIVKTPVETRAYMERILAGGIENPVLVDKYMPGIELEVDVISDGKDVLIPGIMEHIERAGIHSGDSIAVYPPYNLNDIFLGKIVDCSEKLALALGTKGLVNIQYLIWDNELYVIEVNPRASRTVPYISKVTNVPMVDLASRVMLGEPLSSLGYGTGLYRTPPYYTVKVPVFSFEKLNDANSILGPEMKSTGEVLGIGKTMAEALFKGLSASGMKVPSSYEKSATGVLLSVEENDYQEIVGLAKRLYDLGLTLYATTGTAAAVREALGIPVTAVENASVNNEILALMENGSIHYIIYTGAVKDATLGDYTKLHLRAMQLSIPCLTSLDTANALADIMESRFTLRNTELVDICDMRPWRQRIRFAKMHSCGNDYIFVENFDGKITCPESLCVSLCTPHYGIGGDGIVLIEKSRIADAKMRSFNKDGTESAIAGNNLRCVGKYLYDRGYLRSEALAVETGNGVHRLKLYLRDGKVSSVSVDMGKAVWSPASVPVLSDQKEVINEPAAIGQGTYRVTCLSVGNPHCVVFTDGLDALNLRELGPEFEHAPIFPERTNTEFVRMVDRTTLRLRVYERGNGETMACGTGACAAVAAAVKNGLCDAGKDILVKLAGGDMTVNYTDEHIVLTGNAVMVFEGEFEY